MLGIRCSGDDLLQLFVEELVVLGGIEAVVGLDESKLRQPLPKGEHGVSMAGGAMFVSWKSGISGQKP